MQLRLEVGANFSRAPPGFVDQLSLLSDEEAVELLRDGFRRHAGAQESFLGRATELTEEARRALAASHDARLQADHERERLEDASLELDHALASAERERARLLELSDDDLQTFTPYPNDDATTWPRSAGGMSAVCSMTLVNGIPGSAILVA